MKGLTMDTALSRRAFLGHYAGSLGTLALSYLLHQEVRANGPVALRFDYR